jgi:Bacterial toxin 37
VSLPTDDTARKILSIVSDARKISNDIILGPIGSKGSDIAVDALGTAIHAFNQAMYGPLGDTVNAIQENPTVQVVTLAVGAAAVVGDLANVRAGASGAATEATEGSSANPFKGKSPQQLDAGFKNKGFVPRGPAPESGKGGYVNPRSGRSYHIDPGGRYKRGIEKPHVDVNRPNGSKLPKKKFER